MTELGLPRAECPEQVGLSSARLERLAAVIRQDVENKVASIEQVAEVNVEVVWEPQWNQGMMSEAARLQLGLM